MTLGYAPVALLSGIKLGIDKGIFRENGVDLKLQTVANGAAGIALLLNGQLQVNASAGDAAITAVSKKVPLQIVSGIDESTTSSNGNSYETIVPANSSIKSFKDLAGKTVGVNSLQCCWDIWTREATAKDGGDGKSLKTVQIPFAELTAALTQKRVEAVTIPQPYAYSLLSQGYRSLGNPTALVMGPGAIVHDAYMSATYISEHPDAVEKFRRGMAATAAYANAHPDEVRKTIAAETKIPAAQIANAPLPRYTAAVNATSISREAELMKKYGAITSVPSASDVLMKGLE